MKDDGKEKEVIVTPEMIRAVQECIDNVEGDNGTTFGMDFLCEEPCSAENAELVAKAVLRCLTSYQSVD